MWDHQDHVLLPFEVEARYSFAVLRYHRRESDFSVAQNAPYDYELRSAAVVVQSSHDEYPATRPRFEQSSSQCKLATKGAGSSYPEGVGGDCGRYHSKRAGQRAVQEPEQCFFVISGCSIYVYWI